MATRMRAALVFAFLVAMIAPARAEFRPTAFAVDVHLPKDGARAGAAIVIPGLGCAPAALAPITDLLVARGYAVHALAIAGFAGQPAVDTAALGARVRGELARYIADRHLVHPLVVGHSLGGFLAFWLAATDPDAVGPIVIVDAAPNMFSDADPDNVAAMLAHWRGLPAAKFPVAVAQFFGGMANERAKMQPIIDAVARSSPRAFVDALAEMARTDLRPQMARVTAPVLAVLAEGKEFADRVTRQMAPIKDRTIVALANTRHFVFLDDPDGFTRALDAFLAAHRGP